MGSDKCKRVSRLFNFEGSKRHIKGFNLLIEHIA